MSSEPGPVTTDADEVERHPCPRCRVERGSPCRSRSGTVAGTYHTGRFMKVSRLAKRLRVPTPTDRGPGQLWRPGTPPPAPIPSDTPATDIRVGYARCSHLTQELQSQLDALEAVGIDRDRLRLWLITPRPLPDVTTQARGATLSSASPTDAATNLACDHDTDHHGCEDLNQLAPTARADTAATTRPTMRTARLLRRLATESLSTRIITRNTRPSTEFSYTLVMIKVVTNGFRCAGLDVVRTAGKLVADTGGPLRYSKPLLSVELN